MSETNDHSPEPVPVTAGIVENDLDFQTKIRAALKKLPEISTVRAWESAEAYWGDRAGKRMDLMFLDIKLSGMDGVELARKISRRDPGTSIVMLSNLNSDNLVFQALRNGAVGYVLKSELSDLGDIVRTVLTGGAMMTPTIAFRVLTSFRKSNPVLEARLTDREQQILELMVSGKTVARVADTLSVSADTVKFHAKNIYRKLNVHNRSELARKAAAAGLLDTGDL